MATPATAVEIEFVAGSGTYVDVTADVEWSESVQIQYGRTTSYGAPQSATLTFALNNATGKYTPATQLLADGVTANPYYPNVLPRRRVRVFDLISAVRYYRFSGYIRSWPPLMENGARPVITIQAVDRLTYLDKVFLQSPFVQQVYAEATPYAVYLMNDPEPAVPPATFADSGPNHLTAITSYTNLVVNNDPVSLTAEAQSPIPFSDGLTGAQGAQTNSTLDDWGAQLLIPLNQAVIGLAVGFWVTFATQNGALQEVTCDLFGPNSEDVGVTFDDEGTGKYVTGMLTTPPGVFNTGTTVTADGLPHFHMIKCLSVAGTPTLQYTVDGVVVGTQAFAANFVATRVQFNYFQNWGPFVPSPAPVSPMVMGPIVIYTGASSSIPSPVNLTSAGNGWAGDLTGARITRYLALAGISGGDISIDAGKETVGGQHSISGKSLLTACQEIADTESGGAAFWELASGPVRFADRTYRFTTTPVLTLDGQNDLVNGIYQPAYDDLTLLNSSQILRQGGATVSYTDATSVTAYGTSSEQFTVYCSTDQAALNIAQSRVSSQSEPAFRFAQLSVNLITATTAGLFTALASVQVGSRIRITNLAAAKSAPKATMDVYVESWTLTINNTQFLVTFNTTPADNPPRWKWDTSTWQATPGALTLHTTLTNNGTTIVIDRTAGEPALTTSVGSYPFRIKIGEEEIQLNSVPTGTNPQTYTGVTRGANGTRASAQTSPAVITLAPASAWQL